MTGAFLPFSVTSMIIIIMKAQEIQGFSIFDSFSFWDGFQISIMHSHCVNSQLH